MTWSVNSLVERAKPSVRSAVRAPVRRADSTADSMARASCSRPRLWRNAMAQLLSMPTGLAIPRPAMSGAEPWTGS